MFALIAVSALVRALPELGVAIVGFKSSREPIYSWTFLIGASFAFMITVAGVMVAVDNSLREILIPLIIVCVLARIANKRNYRRVTNRSSGARPSDSGPTGVG